MHSNYQRMVLPDVRACDIRRSLEHILELARQEQANPTRPRVGHLMLVEPSDHMLPLCVRNKRELFLAIYDRPQQLIDASIPPLLWTNITPSGACKERCTGHCSGELALEICVDARFPLLPFDVWVQIVDDLKLGGCAWAEAPDIWSAFWMRTEEEPAGDNGAAAAAGAAAAIPSGYDAEEIESNQVWLKNKMRAAADAAQYDPFYDGWMEKYKGDHDGHYPRDPARHFPRLAERLLREIRAERNGSSCAATSG